MYDADRPTNPFDTPSATGAVPGLIYTVSDLNEEADSALGSHFGTVWVQGEISNFTRPSSGHLYFNLKDAGAQVSCAFFRGRSAGLRFRPENGLEVLVRAKVSVYKARGNYQLIVEGMDIAGQGALMQQFEALREKLRLEGLFNDERKRSLPPYPTTVGVVTSASGAAVRDIVSTLTRRAPGLSVVLYPCVVQGATAAPSIVNALERAYRRAECDVLIVGRGGGSMEDLWPFNEESVARKLMEAPMPTVSAVGHEPDVTIADYVADVRAATPTAAAELVTARLVDVTALQQRLSNRLLQGMDRYLELRRLRLARAEQAIGDPRRALAYARRRVEDLTARLKRAQQQQRHGLKAQLSGLERRLAVQDPRRTIAERRREAARLDARLKLLGARLHAPKRSRLDALHGRLIAYSPLATLGRGYAIAFRDENGVAVRSVAEVRPGDALTIQVGDGTFAATVTGGGHDEGSSEGPSQTPGKTKDKIQGQTSGNSADNDRA